ncbi:Cysteine-rich CWC [Chitinophaga skermanii]|uniref:Cysteine-rich CWC n=1 Tax=Chitinophaga skermanii TaxID=331697 RepID=A0A327QVX5_9BACT|nr:cysteine-rich CWC family protein [Chitinophaga skermanii]RAJ08501.1 Cysteine-rich CWC [Chitinophaga skermanii]
MACHETKHCERCGTPFECKIGNVLHCQCSGIRFNDQEKAFIAANYVDCLCRNCLLAVKREVRYKSKLQLIFSILKSR